MRNRVRVGIIRFPGSNCDRDIARVLRLLGNQTEYLWHAEGFALPSYDLIVLPGGFSFGDYEGAGVRAARSRVMDDVKRFAQTGKYVLGICNGFQILTQAELLPGYFLKNKCGTYISKEVYLSPQIKELHSGKKTLKIPIANAYGNYQCSEEELKILQKTKGILLKYCDKNGNFSGKADPTGSLEFIAGIRNAKGNVWGIMPHPERAAGLFFDSSDGITILRVLLEKVRKKTL